MVVISMKTCCGFGHRTITEKIEKDLYSVILKAAQENCELFYTGAMGDFDMLFSSSVRRAKLIFPNIKLICVKPYFTNELNINKEYYYTAYDDLIIPSELLDVHYKAAIKARNRWIVDHSDLIICYITHDFGGAADTIKYAKRQSKPIINLYRKQDRHSQM